MKRFLLALLFFLSVQLPANATRTQIHLPSGTEKLVYVTTIKSKTGTDIMELYTTESSVQNYKKEFDYNRPNDWTMDIVMVPTTEKSRQLFVKSMSGKHKSGIKYYQTKSGSRKLIGLFSNFSYLANKNTLVGNFPEYGFNDYGEVLVKHSEKGKRDKIELSTDTKMKSIVDTMRKFLYKAFDFNKNQVE